MTNDKDSAVLLPCPVPWCGGHATFNNNDYQIECNACGLTSYCCDTEAEALASWNTRQPTQSDPEAMRYGYEIQCLKLKITSLEECLETATEDLIALRQPTQSDALKCEYCDNTGICGWDDNPQFCGECSHGDAAFKGWNARIPVYALKVVREKAIEECAKALEADAMKCDCAALEERECGCGAWCEWKSITSARAVEIVRALLQDS